MQVTYSILRGVSGISHILEVHIRYRSQALLRISHNRIPARPVALLSLRTWALGVG